MVDIVDSDSVYCLNGDGCDSSNEKFQKEPQRVQQIRVSILQNDKLHMIYGMQLITMWYFLAGRTTKQFIDEFLTTF